MQAEIGDMTLEIRKVHIETAFLLRASPIWCPAEEL